MWNGRSLAQPGAILRVCCSLPLVITGWGTWVAHATGVERGNGMKIRRRASPDGLVRRAGTGAGVDTRDVAEQEQEP